MTLMITCPKCKRTVIFDDEHQWQKKCICGETIWTTNTYCFFCGKVTTHLPASQECDNPECLEKYRKVKVEKQHPFWV